MNPIYIEQPKEIFNIWGKHPEDMTLGTEGKSEFSMIPHFFFEFNNDKSVEVIYVGLSGKKDNIRFINVDDRVLRNYLLSVTNSDTKLLFDNLYEGNVVPMVDKIYRAIDGTDIRPDQIHYFSCALDSEKHFEKYCEDFGIDEKIHVYGCNAWEYHLYKTSKIRNIDYEIRPKNKTFLCFNRILRQHRLALVCLILKNDLLKNSYYSFFDDTMYGEFKWLLANLRSNLSDSLYRTIVSEYLNYKRHFPLKLNINGDENINFVKEDDITYFRESYFSLVTETYFFPSHWIRSKNGTILEDDQTIFFSEKIFKPILMKHPFVLVGRPHSLKYLRNLGYKTFSPFINESYDDIENNEERLLAIVDEVARLDKFTIDEWLDWQTNVKEIVEHNHNVISSRKKYEYAQRKVIDDNQ